MDAARVHHGGVVHGPDAAFLRTAATVDLLHVNMCVGGLLLLGRCSRWKDAQMKWGSYPVKLRVYPASAPRHHPTSSRLP